MLIHIFIYPSKKKELNVNEKQFITISEFINKSNFLLIGEDDFPNLETFIKTLDNKYIIKTITILLDNYGTFVYSNLEFIKKNKEITFYIHENDIHKLESKPKTYEKYMAFRSILKDNNHIKILAYYWYHYNNLYDILRENVLCFPKFVLQKNIQKFNENPIPKILLSGSKTSYYPMRKYLNSLNLPNVDVLDRKKKVNGTNYIEYLSNYLCCFTCCLNKNTPYIINKFFEIPSSGSLLLAYDEFIKEPLKEIGFIDGENYISCTKENIISKINWILDMENREKVYQIRKNGYEWVKNNHTDFNRYSHLINLIDK